MVAVLTCTFSLLGVVLGDVVILPASCRFVLVIRVVRSSTCLVVLSFNLGEVGSDRCPVLSALSRSQLLTAAIND